MRGPRQPDEALAVAIDIGGTKTAIGCIALPSGEVLTRSRRMTPPRADSGAAFLAALVAQAGEARDAALAAGWRRLAIGVSLCELVDLAGEPNSAHRVQWQGLAPQAHFAALAPAAVEADVRAAALAEARFGAGRPFRQIAYVNIGTGISSCWVSDGRPHAGARGNAIVLASAPLPAGDGGSGLVPEQVAGGAGLLARYQALGHREVESAIAILERARQGEPDALRLAADAGNVLGASIGWLVNVLDPEAVVIGGGLGVQAGPYWDALLASTRRHIWAEQTRDLPLLHAALGSDSALIGAAAAAGAQLDNCTVRPVQFAGKQ